MRKGLKLRWIAALALPAAASASYGQRDAPAGSAPFVLLASPPPASAGPAPTGEIVREIDDPHNGIRWLLMRDPRHPGGPGRLTPVSELRTVQGSPEPAGEPVRPVIRAGDRLIVEENTAVVEARLEAVALAPAVAGSPLNVRLKIGGKVVRAVAVAPGLAALAIEERP